MESIRYEEKEELIRFLLINSYKENIINSRILQNEKKVKNNKEDIFFDDSDDDEDNEKEEFSSDHSSYSNDSNEKKNISRREMICDDNSNEDEKYEPNIGLIKLIVNKSNDFKTIYKLKQFCRTIIKLISYFRKKKYQKIQ
jgi:hypothetical protein